MTDVGIITFHCADNFGAVLQVYALQQKLSALGMSSEIIDFRPKYLTLRYDTKRNWDKLLKEVGILRSINILSDIIKNRSSIKKRMVGFKKFRDENLTLSKKIYYTSDELIDNPPFYKYYITGSDQVWNPQFIDKIGNSYFLDFAFKNSKKISYAASLAIRIDSSLTEKYQTHLKKFDSISIREKEHLNFINSITQKPVYVTLDPTLLLNKSDWENISIKPNIQDKYILVYDLVADKEMVSLVNRIVKEKGFKVISYSDPKNYHNGIKSFAYDSPTEFLGYIQNAEIILTTSYHGTVFSVIYNKPFYTIPHKTRGSRMIDFLVTLGLENRLVNFSNELRKITYEIDYKYSNNLLNSKKTESLDFLKNVLNISH